MDIYEHVEEIENYINVEVPEEDENVQDGITDFGRPEDMPFETLSEEEQSEATAQEHELIDAINGLIEIERKRIEDDNNRNIEEVRDSNSLDSVSGNDVSDNQVVIVSDNIINKPIKDYDVKESYMFMIFISLFIAGIVILIRKGLPRWH